jgi:hypothetical protein
MSWLRPATRSIVAALVPVLLVAGPVAAGHATVATGSFTVIDQFVDEGTSAACGFDVRLDLIGTRRYEIGFDAAGNPIWLHLLTVRSGTVSANGISLSEIDRENQMFDLTSQALIDAGIVFRIRLPEGGSVALFDRGFIRVDADDNLERIAGPHPGLEGDMSGLCAALSG